MTLRLYQKDVYLREFQADILEAGERNGKPCLVLDRTAFFPEGGGQPCDKGEIGEAKVWQVYEEGEKVIHVTDRIPLEKAGILCLVDWKRRFDHMQQHLGQHVLSAVLLRSFQAETVGFHLGEETVTVDLDRELDSTQVETGEFEANQCLFANLPVEVLYPAFEELEGLSLRKLPPVRENIRLVGIRDLDRVPCCGTHPAGTAEVGLLKVTGRERYKGGLRLSFVCGNRALKDYAWKSHMVEELTSTFSCRGTNLKEKIEALRQEVDTLRKENKQMREEQLVIETRDLLRDSESHGDLRMIKRVFHGRDFSEVRDLAAKLISNPHVVVLFGVNSGEQAQFVLSRSRDLTGINLKQTLGMVTLLLQGKGGGNEMSVQGGGTAVDKLEEALNTAWDELAPDI